MKGKILSFHTSLYSKEKDSDGKYTLIRVFEPFGCGMTWCETKLGHYTYELYLEGHYQRSSKFWIVPDFAEYGVDELKFSIVGGLRRPAICDETENRIYQQNIEASFRCEDWDGADFQFSGAKYDPYIPDGNFTAHWAHFGGEIDISLSDPTPSCRDTNSSFGNISPLTGKLKFNNPEARSYVPTFVARQIFGSLAGKYEFNGIASKTIDGQKFETQKIFKEHIYIGGMSQIEDSPAFYWKNNDTDKHFPYNKYMNTYSISKMEDLLLDFLIECIWSQEGRDGVRFVLTDANLKGGGFFDKPSDYGVAPPWPKAHTRHRLGYNVDMSRRLSDGVEFHRDEGTNKVYRNNFEDSISRNSDGRSVCKWHDKGTAPHWHCNFRQ